MLDGIYHKTVSVGVESETVSHKEANIIHYLRNHFNRKFAGMFTDVEIIPKPFKISKEEFESQRESFFAII